MASSSLSSSSRSWKYDVFLSFRGEDTRKTFVDHLYYALKRRTIRTYKDDEALPRGDTIGPSLMKAIDDSQIALIIFSKNYANSSWCLDELDYIMKWKKDREQIVMPVFYHVEPTDVRNQKGKYGEAFDKHEFEKNKKVESWRKALFEASNIGGWEINLNVNEHEAKAIEDIVGTVLDKILSLNSDFDEELVGMGTRLQDLTSQLEIGSRGVRMIGIWGIGGGGKTTLASSLYMKISDEFDCCCFLGNIKAESSKLGIESLQEKILSGVLKTEVKVPSVDIGKRKIKGILKSRNVLIVLDDVDDRKQLEALAGSHDWFGDGSRIVITTRDKHLLNAHKVNKVCSVSLLSDEEAIRLFNKHAYNEDNIVEDYKSLSRRVVSYAGGLPLALIVLGSFLSDKNDKEWNSTLNRLKNIPDKEIAEKLKISYDGLEPLEKELFLDIACFFYRGMKKDKAMMMLDACGFHADVGVKVLMQKGLVTIKSLDNYAHRKPGLFYMTNVFGKRDVFDMHDLIQELGRYIVRGEHSRLWRSKEIEDIPTISVGTLASSSSSRAWKYDVFLSFGGEDNHKTFVEHLYSALHQRKIRTYKDDEILPRGDTIVPSLANAIEDSHMAIIIFSEHYAYSSRCLDELAYIMKCQEEGGQIVMTIFYHVEPMDVRKQKRKYEEAFVKHGSENNNCKVESWRKALVAAGNIAGWEINHNVNGYEAKCIKDVVGTILDKLLSLNSVVDENLVGMGTRLQDLKLKLLIGSGGVLMVGIWGMAGSGKTTLASSLYMENFSKFDSCCFLENIRVESSELGIVTLQEKIISAVFKTEVKVPSVDIGKDMIKRRLGCKNVLLVLDDIDKRTQIEALAGSHNWFGDGSRIVITSRDEWLLRTHGVDEVSVVSLLSEDESLRLLSRCAYNEDKPIEDYKILLQRLVSYASGLPLALKVLGSFLYDKNKEEWISTLDRLKDISEMEIVEILKISYEQLNPIEEELFLDIACFYRGMKKDKAMVMLDACGFHPVIGEKVLMQKSLTTISSEAGVFGIYDVFNMHDLVQEMGHYIVRGKHPHNPENHSRLWRFEEIEDICSGIETMEHIKTEAIICHRCPSSFGKLVSKAKNLRLLSVGTLDVGDTEAPEYISNKLRYLFWERYPASPFPESFQLRSLVVLRLKDSLQEELWRGHKYLPNLKELHLSSTNLVSTPDFGGLPRLEKLTLSRCSSLEEIHPSLGNHTSLVYVKVKHCIKLRQFPTIVQMGKLTILGIYFCNALSKFPMIESKMPSLENLSLYHVGIEALPSSIGEYCTNLRSLILYNCSNLKSIEGNFHALKHLRECKIRGDYKEGIMLPKNLFNENFI